jgi:hypothetical protein
MDAFVSAGSGGLSVPVGLVFNVFGDGNLYVSDFDGNAVKRYNGTSGAFIDNFVTPGSGGLTEPSGLDFRPGGALYVSSTITNEIKSYDGNSGAFLGDTVTAGAQGLNSPEGLVFDQADNDIVWISGTVSNFVAEAAVCLSVASPGARSTGRSGSTWTQTATSSSPASTTTRSSCSIGTRASARSRRAAG